MRDKASEELAIFRQFAEARPLAIDAGSIRGREPPEPDIACALEDGTKLRFELTSADAQMAQRTESAEQVVAKECTDFLAGLPAERRGELQSRLANAFVRVRPNMRRPASRGAIRKALPQLFDRLRCVAPDFAGQIHRDSDRPWAKYLRASPFVEVSIKRFDSIVEGPIFNLVHAVSGFVDLQEALARKLAKHYPVGPPIHLLVHYTLGIPGSSWDRQDLRRAIGEKMAGGSFQGVWLFDCLSKTVDAVPGVSIPPEAGHLHDAAP